MDIAQNLREILGPLGIGETIGKSLKLLGCNDIIKITVICGCDKTLNNGNSQKLTLCGIGNTVVWRETYPVAVGTENLVAIGINSTNFCRRQKIKLTLKMGVVGVLLHRP